MMTTLTPQEQAIREELEATLAEIEAQIEAELNKLLPLLDPKTAAILAIELEISTHRGCNWAFEREATRVR